jgi:hypothetical protein
MWCCKRSNGQRPQHQSFHQVPCQAPHHHHSSIFREPVAPSRHWVSAWSSRMNQSRSRSECNPDIDYAKLYCIDHLALSPVSQSDSSGTGAAAFGASVDASAMVLSSGYVRPGGFGAQPQKEKGHLVCPGGPHAVNALMSGD